MCVLCCAVLQPSNGVRARHLVVGHTPEACRILCCAAGLMDVLCCTVLYSAGIVCRQTTAACGAPHARGMPHFVLCERRDGFVVLCCAAGVECHQSTMACGGP